MTANKHYIGAGLIALALALAWVLDYSAYGGISSLRAAIAEREQVASDRQTTLDNVRRLERDYESRKDQVARFAAVIPDEKSAAELVSALEAIAARSGIQLTEIATSAITATTKDPYNALALSIKARGPYASLYGFLDGTEKNIRLIDLDSVEAASDEAQAGVLNVIIRGKVYFLK